MAPQGWDIPPALPPPQLLFAMENPPSAGASNPLLGGYLLKDWGYLSVIEIIYLLLRLFLYLYTEVIYLLSIGLLMN